ncbi:hypothetical protein I316_00601 [Kwoniella heveanensis BCC8398]|uniref:Palmitoyltransferase n=1 Tax=Kwoniella heveanensis BCC8398 TaxID=1296120 RepID=A0A1B9H2J6_9TREE|nr:hypothetical protein I316_00601 [Kwoniella heveanensis BCC8398]
MLFMLFISLGEILIRRREIGRFLEQVVIYQFLLGMTLLSLMTTASRPPGEPDQTLAPPMSKRERKPATLIVPKNAKRNSSKPESSTYPPRQAQLNDRDGNDADDNVPLRFLKNAQWVNSRIGKDRPSPLPMPSTRRYPPSPPGAPASSSTAQSTLWDDSSTRGTMASGFQLESESGSETEFSPFPLSAFSASAKSPFVPNTAEEAGEDDDDCDQEEAIDRMAERGPSNEDGVTNGLLSSRTDGSQDRSLMAKSNTGEARWCKKCEGWKPDRCHHCRHCEQCVLKMDHHCPWVGSCVGYHNYKPFFLFINYATLLALYATLEAGYETFRFFQDPDAAVPHSQMVQLEGTSVLQDGLGLSPAVFMMLFVMGGFMTLAVGGLTIFHWYLATHNQTTLENITHSHPSALLDAPPKGKTWKADHLLTRSERFRLREEAREINVYDLGWKRNLKDLLIGGEGTKVGKLGWVKAFFPIGRPMRSDGRAGHYFAYDAAKLDRLKELTAELRYGVKAKRTVSNEDKRSPRFSHDSIMSIDDGDMNEYDAGDDEYELDDRGEVEKLVGTGKIFWQRVRKGQEHLVEGK